MYGLSGSCAHDADMAKKQYEKFGDGLKNTYLCTRILSYGVMVALQFLVLSVVVRVRLGQQNTLQTRLWNTKC